MTDCFKLIALIFIGALLCKSCEGIRENNKMFHEYRLKELEMRQK